MARGRPVILTTRSFSKKGDAIKYFGEMLNSYKPGDRVTDAHAADLASLLERHPESSEKIGDGIHHFEVQAADYSTQCFRVVRLDGTWSKFSYHTCVSTEPAIAG